MNFTGKVCENIVQNFTKHEEVTYAYETTDTGVFESKVLIEGLEFASVESLNNEIERQFAMMVFKGDDDYDEDEIWAGEKIEKLIIREKYLDTIICKEGAFLWDESNYKYEYAGRFSKEDIKRIKRIVVPEDKAILINNEIIVVYAGTYDVLKEDILTIGTNVKIELFTIQLNGGRIVAIPNHIGVFNVYETDIALIDYIDKYK